MKKTIVLLVSLFFALNIYSQTNYYQDGRMGTDNINAMFNIGRYGFLHSFSVRNEGTRGTPNLFNSLVNSYILLKDQEKYIQVDSDIDMMNNSVIFADPTTGKLVEIYSDNIKELVFKKFENEVIFRSTKELKFEKKIKENKFYQVIHEGHNRMIMVTFKTFVKSDDEPAFNSGRHFNEFRTDRKYYLEDSKGVFHQVIINNITYDCLVHPSRIDKQGLAKIFPEKKDVIYSAFQEKPDSISVERIISIIEKF
jgi:hypothetical protein